MRALLSTLVGCAFALTLSAQDVTKRGKFFEVTVHGGNEAMAAQALAAVEPVWKFVCETFGAQGMKPKKLLPVHLYRTADAYRTADRKLTGGQFQENQAMCHWGTKSAHVAMQPPVTDAFLAKAGLPLQTQAMLAWEACHISRYELCAGNFKLHPGWFCDGLAETTSHKVMKARYPDLSDAQPFYSSRWSRTQRMIDEEKLPSVKKLLSDDTADLHMRDRYAARVALFVFLSDKRTRKLRAFAATVRMTGGGTRYQATVRKAAIKAFGGMDRAFVSYAKDVDRRWDERGRSLWCVGDEWQQIAFPDSRAFSFATRPIQGGAFEAKGVFRVESGRQLNFLFGRTDGGFYSLALFVNGGFTLFDRHYKNNQWRRIGGFDDPAMKRGVDIEFVVRCRGKKLEVQLGDKDWHLQLPRRLPDDVYWGVGAQGNNKAATGSAGYWRGLTVGKPKD